MKRPRILIDLMVRRRQRAEKLVLLRRRCREFGIPVRQRWSLLEPWDRAPIPRVTARSLLDLASENRIFALSRWHSHDTETYSACGWDDHQIDLRRQAQREAIEYARAARFLLLATTSPGPTPASSPASR